MPNPWDNEPDAQLATSPAPPAQPAPQAQQRPALPPGAYEENGRYYQPVGPQHGLSPEDTPESLKAQGYEFIAGRGWVRTLPGKAAIPPTKPGARYVGADGRIHQTPIGEQDLTWQEGEHPGTGQSVGIAREISSVPFPEGTTPGQEATTTGTFFLTPDEGDRRAAIAKAFPNAEFAQGPNGQTVVRYDANSPWAYMNAPGFSGEDITTLGSQAVQYLPAGGLAALGKGSLAARAALGAVGSGATSVAQDVAAGAVSGQDPVANIDPSKAAVAAGFGAGGEVASSLISAGAGAAARGAAQAAPPAVQQTLRDLPVIGDAFAERASQSTGFANEHGVPLSRGQANGDYPQIAFEQAAARGARGEAAGTAMRSFLTDQGEAVARTGREMVPPVGETAQDAASVVQQGMRTAEQGAKGEVNAAYDAVRASDGQIGAPTVAELPGRIREGLNANFMSPDDLASLNPSAARIYKEIERLAGSGQAGEAMPVAGLERLRQGINANLRSAQGQDRAALQIMKREFDKWIDEAVDKGLMSGDENAINLIRQARSVNRDYRALYGPDKGGAEADKLMRRLLDENATESDAANLLFGTQQVRGTGGAVDLVRRIKTATGGKGETWDALRSGSVQRLVGRLQATDRTIPSYQGYVKAWDEALNGSGRPLMRELFSADELRAMRNYVNTVRKLVPPEGAVNRSGTGYEIARAIAQTSGLLNRIPGLNLVTGASGDISAAAKVGQSVTPRGQPLPRVPFVAGLAASLGVAQQTQDQNPQPNDSGP